MSLGRFRGGENLRRDGLSPALEAYVTALAEMPGNRSVIHT